MTTEKRIETPQPAKTSQCTETLRRPRTSQRTWQPRHTSQPHRTGHLRARMICVAAYATLSAACASLGSSGDGTQSTGAADQQQATAASTHQADNGHWTLNTHYTAHCWSTNNHVDCDFTLYNNPESTVAFDWQAASDPQGAQFTQVSGSIEPGESQSLHASADLGCHVVFAFVDQTHNSVTRDDWKASNC